MKKILVLTLTGIILLLTGCATIEIKGNISENASSSEISTVVSSSSKADTTSDVSGKNDTKKDNKDNKDTVTSKTSSTTSSSNPISSLPSGILTGNKTSSNSSSPSKITSSNKVSSSTPLTDDQILNSTPAPEVIDGVVCYTYEFEGTINDWFTENDFVYATFQNNNRLLVFNTNNGDVIFNKPLSGRPGELKKIGNELWIAFPDLKCIKVYNFDTLSEKKTIRLAHSAYSFDTYGDYLIYAEEDQWVEVYRYNLKTAQEVQVKFRTNGLFYEASILLNGQQGVFYVGESGNSGSTLFCYDIETLELKSIYDKDNYGYGNRRRRMLLSDGYLYWGEFKFNQSDISYIEAQYTSNYQTGMLHVDDNVVITTGGIFVKDTCEKAAEVLLGGYDNSICITKSGNVFITELGKVGIFTPEK